jgi:hypothetical protein
VTVTEMIAIGTAAATVLGAIGMLIRDRRSGRLSADEHQRLYIQDQQEDIAALRRDLSQLWTWAVKAVRMAAKEGIELDPLPSEPPQSKSTASGKGA